MNLNNFFKVFGRSLPALAFFGLLQSNLAAATFTYTNVDLVAGFRITGGSADLVVDLGSVSNYESLPLRTVITVTNVQGAQLNAAFPSLNKVNWSVTGAMRGNTNYPQYPLQTIWLTSPRPTVATAGPVFPRKGQFTQGTVAGQIDAIGADAVTYGNSVPASTTNTQTGIVIPSTDPNSYTSAMGTNGDLSGSVQFDMENLTPTNFTSTNIFTRSVLYKLLPGTGTNLNAPGMEIGYFDFHPDGSLTFTAGPAPERTTVTKIQYAGNVATLFFPTINLVSYRLHFTDGAGLMTPISTWTTSGNSILGNGTVMTLQDTNAFSVRFYTVESF